jgi:DNA-binding GntR family transcriptional regulator
MLTAIERSSLAVEVARKLRFEILTGNIKPGEKLLEHDLSNSMKTSRGPVRDALVQLEHEGIVSREYNRSATVVRMTAADVEEVSSLRLCLEQLSLKYVVQKAQDADIQRLDELVRRLKVCLAENFTLTEAVDLDLQFHEEIVAASKHNRLLAMWQSIKTQIWFLIFTRNAFNLREFEAAAKNHEDLVAAIRDRDIGRALDIIQRHEERAYARLIGSYRDSDADR